MNPEISPTGLLRGVTGWEGARCKRLTSGLSGSAWQVVAGQHRAVLKLDEARRGVPFVSRRDEAAVQGRAAAEGLAPAVLFAADQALLSAFVTGRNLSAEDLAEPSILQQIGRLLRQVHRLPLTGRRFDALAAGEVYTEAISPTRQEMAKACLQVLSESPSGDILRCCHNDPVAANFVLGESLFLLDWEYAADNDPLFDLAAVIEHHRLDAAAAGQLLAAYGADSRHLASLAQQRRIYLALLWLWMAAREDAGDGELRAVAARLATSDCVTP